MTTGVPGIVARMRPAVGAVVVFLAAAAVLMLEILAARMLAPYVGVSLNTYTGIIGTVLAGIAAGSWAFGRLADSIDPRLLLGPLLIAGGLLALASAPLVNGLGEHVHSDSLKAILALAGATFFLPAFVLSGVTPVVVKLQLHSLAATGRTVGNMSGAGTFGALVGTFGTGFFLTSRVHTHTIVLAIGIVLVCLGVAVLWRMSPRVSVPALVIVALASVAGGVAAATVTGPCQTESGYFCIRTIGDSQHRLLILDNIPHSAVNIADPTSLDFGYARIEAATIDTVVQPRRPIRALHIGGGAFTMPLYVNATRPGSINKVLEIDPAVVDVAKEKFSVKIGPRIRVKEGDARLSVAAEPLGSYDIVFGDAFSSRSVPWHLTTKEFLGRVRRLLRSRGAYVMNLIDAGAHFARAEAATMRSVFGAVTLIQESGSHNLVLVGTNQPLDTARLIKLLEQQGIATAPVTGPALSRFIGDAHRLTDDFAPVDQLLK
jgi:MFS family permease